jgi:hypothetical protein
MDSTFRLTPIFNLSSMSENQEHAHALAYLSR